MSVILNPCAGYSSKQLSTKEMSSVLSTTHQNATIGKSSFKLFSKLPLELRLMIWKRSVPAARLITIRGSGGSQEDTDPALRQAKVASTEIMPLAGMLQACRDSRKVMLKIYTLAFHNRLLAPIYIDFNRDSLFFTDPYAIKDFVPFTDLRTVDMKEIEEKVERIMLGSEVRRSASRSLEGLLKFGNLDRMIFEAGNDVNNAAVLKHVYKELFEWSWQDFQGRGKVRSKIEERSREEMKKRWGFEEA